MAQPFPMHTPTPMVTLITSTITSAATNGFYQNRPTGSSTPNPDDGPDGNLIERLASGARVAIIVGIVMGIVFIILFSSWFCCGCCGIRNQQRSMAPDGTRRIPSTIAPAVPATGGSLPLQPIQNDGPPGRHIPSADPAPPSYEEVVLPRNQAPPGGMPYNRMSEHEGMVVDGKTPLSEMVFEDVDIDRPHTGGSSNQTFEQRHHGAAVGDTRGHTNS